MYNTNKTANAEAAANALAEAATNALAEAAANALAELKALWEHTRFPEI